MARGRWPPTTPRSWSISPRSRPRPASYRDAIAALRKVKDLKQTDAEKQRADRLRGSIDTKAKAKADEFLHQDPANRNGSWVDGFLAFRDEFEFADGARAVMAAFEALRKKQEPDAQRLFKEAIMLFRQGNQAGATPSTRRSSTRTTPRRGTATSRSSSRRGSPSRVAETHRGEARAGGFHPPYVPFVEGPVGAAGTSRHTGRRSW